MQTRATNKRIYSYHTDGTEPPVDIKPWILVFGSNLAGRHGGGAALLARTHYGAKYGVGYGQEGRSFAIPTKDENIQTLSLNRIGQFVSLACRYMYHRVTNAHERYWVTAIGTQLAGYDHKDIAPMFIDLAFHFGAHAGGPNINLADHFSFPEEWFEFLEPQTFHEEHLERALFEVTAADTRLANTNPQPTDGPETLQG